MKGDLERLIKGLKLPFCTLSHVSQCPRGHYVIEEDDMAGYGVVGKIGQRLVVEEVFYCASCDDIYLRSELRKELESNMFKRGEN
jgi:hypothetical protein